LCDVISVVTEFMVAVSLSLECKAVGLQSIQQRATEFMVAVSQALECKAAGLQGQLKG
jgi:hypothetical protein